MWIDLWRDKRLGVQLVPGMGLGLVARKAIKIDEEICRAVIDSQLVDYRCGTLMTVKNTIVAILGPAALANSRCAAHAHAKLSIRRAKHALANSKEKEMILVALRPIANGGKICATYDHVGEDPLFDCPMICSKPGCKNECYT